MGHSFKSGITANVKIFQGFSPLRSGDQEHGSTLDLAGSFSYCLCKHNSKVNLREHVALSLQLVSKSTRYISNQK